MLRLDRVWGSESALGIKRAHQTDWDFHNWCNRSLAQLSPSPQTRPVAFATTAPQMQTIAHSYRAR